MGFSLNSNDKDFLYRKYIKLGLTPKEAYDNVKTLNEHLKFLEAKYKAKRINESDIKNRLQQAFEQKCMEIESKF